MATTPKSGLVPTPPAEPPPQRWVGAYPVDESQEPIDPAEVENTWFWTQPMKVGSTSCEPSPQGGSTSYEPMRVQSASGEPMKVDSPEEEFNQQKESALMAIADNEGLYLNDVASQPLLF